MMAALSSSKTQSVTLARSWRVEKAEVSTLTSGRDSLRSFAAAGSVAAVRLISASDPALRPALRAGHRTPKDG